MSPSTQRKRNLQQWTLDRFGNGFTAPCHGCGATLSRETLTLDRFPLPGAFGGTYRRGNIRPMCEPCNSSHVDEPGYGYRLGPEGLQHRPFQSLEGVNAEGFQSPFPFKQERDRQQL